MQILEIRYSEAERNDAGQAAEIMRTFSNMNKQDSAGQTPESGKASRHQSQTDRHAVANRTASADSQNGVLIIRAREHRIGARQAENVLNDAAERSDWLRADERTVSPG